MVLLLPCGKSAHLEVGYAAGAKKPVLLYAPEPLQPELMYGMCTAVTEDLEDVVTFCQGKWRFV